MTEQKFTRKDLFNRIIDAMSEDAEVVAMCEKYIEQLSKPRVVKIKPEQEEFRAEVLELLKTFEDGATNKEMCERYRDNGGEVTPQKMSGALRWLVSNGDAQTLEVATRNDAKIYIALPDDGGFEFEPDAA